MNLSIIIPAFNEDAGIANTLQRIKHAIQTNHNDDLSYEIIVCDNNSTDRTAIIAKENGATVVFEAENHIAKARNQGAEHAQGEWLLFIDADTYPTPELMNDILDVMKEDRYIGCGTTVQVEGGTLFNKLRMERLNPIFRLFQISGGALLLSRNDAYQSINGFSTLLYAYEDVDFVLRLKWLGWKQGESFRVLHKHPVITSGRKGDYNFFSIFTMFFSNIMAVIIFILHYILPQKLISVCGSSLYGYWYNNRK